MGRTLRYLGLLILAGAAWFLVADEAGWISSKAADPWVLPLLRIGAVTFGLGLLLGLLRPLLRGLGRGRCVRCGATTERGQSYCLDHLQATVLEAQDEMRRTMDHRGRRRP